MVQEHERGLGNWQAELAESAGLYLSAHGAVAALAEAAEGLQVDPVRMQRNIDALAGPGVCRRASMALAAHIGKARAHALLESLSGQVVGSGRPLGELLAGPPAETTPHSREALGPGSAPAQLPQRISELFSAERAAQAAIHAASARS